MAVPASRGRGVTLEEGVFGLRVESGCGFVEDQEQGCFAHEAAGEGQLLPLTEPDVGASRPARTELGFNPRLQRHHNIGSTRPIDRRGDGGEIVQTRHVAEADGKSPWRGG